MYSIPILSISFLTATRKTYFEFGPKLMLRDWQLDVRFWIYADAVAEGAIFVLDKMIGGFENDGEKFEHQKLNHQPHNFLKSI